MSDVDKWDYSLSKLQLALSQYGEVCPIWINGTISSSEFKLALSLARLYDILLPNVSTYT